MVTRELSKGHGISDNGVKTRATTARQTARTSKESLTQKSNKIPASKLSRVDEEQVEWENEELPPLMNPSQHLVEYQDKNTSKTKTRAIFYP